MPNLTPKLGLKKPLGNETVSRAAYNENLDLIDQNVASQADLDAHKNASAPHSGHALTSRKINTGAGLQGGGDLSADRTISIADGGVTDAMIGERTISDTTAPTGDMGTMTNLWSWLAYMIKAITGKTNWRTLPAMTIEAIASLLNAATNAATANTLVKRDASGRFKAGAPSASDDVARKAETDAAISAAQAMANTAEANAKAYADGKFLPSSSYTANDVLTKIKTVDGAGSGLDADLLDGKQAGNASGEIPINNGVLNVNLNAERVNGHKITVSSTAPSNPAVNDIWIQV